jgi:RHS repeat-associated protein
LGYEYYDQEPNQGRPKTIHYPTIITGSGGSSYQVSFQYDAPSGSLKRIDDPNGARMWEASGRNFDGRIISEIFGDNSTGSRVWEPERGLLKSSQVHASQDQPDVFVENLAFTYDALGYPSTRCDYVTGKTEAFIHDELGRLRHWSNSDDTWYVHYDYDDLGNMTRRSRYSSSSPTDDTVFTTSPSSRPHIATAMTVNGYTTNFGYDSTGRRNSVDTTSETVSYTDFDLPTAITRGANSWAFKYDASHNRVFKQGPSGSTLYFGSLYERRKTASGVITHVMYVPGDAGDPVAQVTQADGSGTDPKIEYLHVDHIGSTTTITSKDALAIRMAFEPFGERVDRNNPPAVKSSNDDPGVTLGFAGHEQEDDLRFINMRGRIYDPTTARFLTADPMVTRPLKSQEFNRYSYANNSPLRLVDPTGFQEEAESSDAAEGYSDEVFGSGELSCGMCVYGGGYWVSPSGLASQYQLSVDWSMLASTSPTSWNVVDDGSGRGTSQMCSVSNNLTENALLHMGDWAKPYVQAINESTARLDAYYQIVNAGVTFWSIAYGAAGGAVAGTMAREALVMAPEALETGTTTFFRGMTYGEALEAAEAQALNAERIAANQALNPGAAGSGAYLTTQEATAVHYGQLAGLQGRGLGPAVVSIEVSTPRFTSFAATHGIEIEVAIPKGPFPGATETLIPLEHLEEFNNMSTFKIHF